MTDLPGWADSALGDCATFTRGVGYKKEQVRDTPSLGYVPILRAGNLQAGRIVWDDLVYVPQSCVSPEQVLAEGDIVVAMSSGSVSVVGKASIVTRDDAARGASFGAFCGLWRPVQSDLGKWAAAFFQTTTYRNAVSAAALGVNINNLRASHIGGLPIAIPPVAEQKRIGAKVEELTTRSRRAKEALDAVPALHDRLRQSILAAACSGRFTSRANDPRSKPPSNWYWSKLCDLAMPDGIFDGARDHGEGTAAANNLRTSDYTDSGVRVIRLENLAPLSFVHGKTTYISEGKYAGLMQASVSAGDILFGSFIEERVRVCVLPELDTRAIAKADCFCIRARRDVVHPEYLALQLACERTRLALREQVHGATRPRITTKQLREIRIPVCGLDEQQEIISKVAELFATIGKAEESHAEMAKDLVRLEQSLLAKAFRGELVPQDPNDEPASVLLEQIRAARAAAESQGAEPRRRPRNVETSTGSSADIGDAAADRPLAAAADSASPSPSEDLANFGQGVAHDVVFAALWPHGLLEKDAAVRRVADHFRVAGHVQFQRLRAEGPLYRHFLDCIESAVKAGRLSRPKRGYVRACKADGATYNADDWRHALVTSLGTTPTDREDAIRAAAEWARYNLGLNFTRLRTDGHIVEGLRSAINSAIRRCEVIRHDATRISRAPRIDQ